VDRFVPSFPTKTFPNHYTLVTGLHPGNHGIVANSMYDPEMDASFSMSNEAAVTNGDWWDDGEPIWVTAEQQGLRAATYFWPGSEAEIDGTRPSYWTAYDGSVPGNERVDTVLDWLDLPEA
jgi:predicted AlkP superfamily pyrophosphatase or phosphodiesterase